MQVSKIATSLRITEPKNVLEMLGIKESEIVGFYEENGTITIRKIE